MLGVLALRAVEEGEVLRAVVVVEEEGMVGGVTAGAFDEANHRSLVSPVIPQTRACRSEAAT